MNFYLIYSYFTKYPKFYAEVRKAQNPNRQAIF